MSKSLKRVYGFLAEFDNAQDLYKAARQVTDAGYRRWDVHSPYPIHGMDDAMGLGRSRLPYFVFFGGAAGLLIGFLLAYITQVQIYPTVVQAKPTNIFTTPAFFPIMFELTILVAAFTTLFGCLAMMQLPRLNHPLFNSSNFRRFSDDGFFISVEARDPKFSQQDTRQLLERAGGRNLELIQEEI